MTNARVINKWEMIPGVAGIFSRDGGINQTIFYNLDSSSLEEMKGLCINGLFSKDPELQISGDPIWISMKEESTGQLKLFSRRQTRESGYGKDHSFQDIQGEFINGDFGNDYVSECLRLSGVEEWAESMCISEEGFHTNPEKWEKYKGKDILIVVAGPSAKDTRWKDIPHDYLWTCNEFYRSGLFNKNEIDLAVMASGIDLIGNKELETILAEEPELQVSLEIERGFKDTPGEVEKAYKFVEKYKDRVTFQHPRYTSVLGVGPRMLVQAMLVGARSVSIIGFDGRDLSEHNGQILNTFNAEGKTLPSWYARPDAEQMQSTQFVTFWEYVNELAHKSGCSVYNLGQDSGLNKSAEITKRWFPWSNEVKDIMGNESE